MKNVLIFTSLIYGASLSAMTFDSARVQVCGFYGEGIDHMLEQISGKGNDSIFDPNIVAEAGLNGRDATILDFDLTEIYKTVSTKNNLTGEQQDLIFPVYNSNFAGTPYDQYPMTLLAASGKGNGTRIAPSDTRMASRDDVSAHVRLQTSGIRLMSADHGQDGYARNASFRIQPAIETPFILDGYEEIRVAGSSTNAPATKQYALEVSGKGNNTSFTQSMDPLAGPISHAVLLGGGALNYHLNGCDRFSRTRTRFQARMHRYQSGDGSNTYRTDSRYESRICGDIGAVYGRIKHWHNQNSSLENFENLMALEAATIVASSAHLYLVTNEAEDTLKVRMGVYNNISPRREYTYKNVDWADFVHVLQVYLGLKSRVTEQSDNLELNDPEYLKAKYEESLLEGMREALPEFDCLEIEDNEPDIEAEGMFV